MFPRSNQNRTTNKEFVLDLVQEHLTLLHQKYYHYWFTINTEQCSLIRNPFSAKAAVSVHKLSLPVRKKHSWTTKWQNPEIKFQRCSTWCALDLFWRGKRISKVDIEIPIQFCITYLCEQNFLLIENDKRSMPKSSGWRTSSFKCDPNVQRLCSTPEHLP